MTKIAVCSKNRLLRFGIVEGTFRNDSCSAVAVVLDVVSHSLQAAAQQLRTSQLQCPASLDSGFGLPL